MQPRCRWPLSQEFIADSRSACFSSGPPGHFLQNCFLVSSSSARTSAWDYSCPGAELFPSHCWTSQGSHQPISVVSRSSDWQQITLAYPPLLICKLARGLRTCAPSSRSLMKILSGIGPSTEYLCFFRVLCCHSYKHLCFAHW